MTAAFYALACWDGSILKRESVLQLDYLSQHFHTIALGALRRYLRDRTELLLAASLEGPLFARRLASNTDT